MLLSEKVAAAATSVTTTATTTTDRYVLRLSSRPKDVSYAKIGSTWGRSPRRRAGTMVSIRGAKHRTTAATIWSREGLNKSFIN